MQDTPGLGIKTVEDLFFTRVHADVENCQGWDVCSLTGATGEKKTRQA